MPLITLIDKEPDFEFTFGYSHYYSYSLETLERIGFICGIGSVCTFCMICNHYTHFLRYGHSHSSDIFVCGKCMTASTRNKITFIEEIK